LFVAAASSANARRDSAIAALLFVLGLRLSELVALELHQVDLVVGVLRDVRGKGGTVTQFQLPRALVEILAAWLRVRALAAPETEALFPTARPASSRTKRLSMRSVQRIVGRLARTAGIDRAIGPHALRHACGTAAIKIGVDVATTSKVMRHANIATTSIYLHVADDERAEPIARLASLIPASALPSATASRDGTVSQNHAEILPNEGVLPPVDFQPL
jgi:site-specific recombinase XerC